MIDLILNPQSNIRENVEKKEKPVSGDRPYISLLKAVSWRVVGTIDTVAISYIITGQVRSALSIGGFEVFSKMLLYYLHERAWNKALKSKKED